MGNTNSQAQYKHSRDKYTEVVFYEGTDTLHEGYCLCYNADYGTAASADEERRYRVEKPAAGNVRNFAGWVHPSSEGLTGPCAVRIYKPGSICNVYGKVNATVNVTRMTVCAGQYYMYTAGFEGQGSALAQQTIDRSSTAGLILAITDTGNQSGGVEVVTPANGAMTIGANVGVTFFPATTIGTGNATYTLADGTRLGQKKAFIAEGTMTTNDVVVTVTTPAVPPIAGSTAGTISAHNTFTIDAAGEHLYAEWNGKAWNCSGSVATTV